MPAIPVLPLEGALPLTTPALEGVQEALDSDDAAALMQSSVAKTLFTKCIAAAVTFNRSRARPANDPEQQALFMTTETIESLLKVRTDLKLAHLEDALVKAGIAKAFPAVPAAVLTYLGGTSAAMLEEKLGGVVR